jgi:ABC-type bacteriocin/lantibiotic exporter with double-glycine peptidase domain
MKAIAMVKERKFSFRKSLMEIFLFSVFLNVFALLSSFLLADRAVNSDIKISISNRIKWLHYYFLLLHVYTDSAVLN